LEELLLEDNPLKARPRKANQDVTQMSAEMRQMEEQYAPIAAEWETFPDMLLPRFTSYDYRKMKRRSYYPHNHIVSTATASTSRPSTPANQTDSRMASVDVMPPLPATKMVPLEKAEAMT
jgi:serine/threonine kinase 32